MKRPQKILTCIICGTYLRDTPDDIRRHFRDYHPGVYWETSGGRRMSILRSLVFPEG